MLNKRQAIIWNNADPVHWCLYVTWEGDELTPLGTGGLKCSFWFHFIFRENAFENSVCQKSPCLLNNVYVYDRICTCVLCANVLDSHQHYTWWRYDNHFLSPMIALKVTMTNQWWTPCKQTLIASMLNKWSCSKFRNTYFLLCIPVCTNSCSIQIVSINTASVDHHASSYNIHRIYLIRIIVQNYLWNSHIH